MSGVRSTLDDLLLYAHEAIVVDDATSVSQDQLIALLAPLVTPIFAAARLRAQARPVIYVCGVEVPSPIVGCFRPFHDPGARPETEPEPPSEPSPAEIPPRADEPPRALGAPQAKFKGGRGPQVDDRGNHPPPQPLT